MAYILESIRTMPENLSKSYSLKITSGDSSFSGEYIFGAIFNSRSVGGFTGFPGSSIEEKLAVDLQDGEFEVLLIRSPKNIGELGEIAGTLLRGDIPENHPYVSFFKTHYLEFQGEKPVEWTLDGEFGGSYKHTEIMVKREGVIIRIP